MRDPLLIEPQGNSATFMPWLQSRTLVFHERQRRVPQMARFGSMVRRRLRRGHDRGAEVDTSKFEPIVETVQLDTDSELLARGRSSALTRRMPTLKVAQNGTRMRVTGSVLGTLILPDFW